MMRIHAPKQTLDPHDTGPAYRSVLELGGSLVLGRKAHLLTLFCGDERVHLDLEGRLHRGWLSGDSIQRGLDGRLRRVRVERTSPLDRWIDITVLPRSASESTLARVAELVRVARSALPADAPPAIAEPLKRASAWDTERYAAEATRFDQVYEPIPILPPDQNRAVVFQATSGCAWNRCHFCHLYEDVRFHAKDRDELHAHVREALELIGAALPLRRGVFLGQANALCIELAKLRDIIQIIRTEADDAAAREGAATGSRAWPIGSFIDSFTRRHPSAGLAELRGLGLESVALGLESGSDRVLDELGKPAEVTDAIDLVRELGDAGLRRGIIVLVGAGGERFATEHVEATVRAITAMDLGRRDRVYLSPLHVEPQSPYMKRARHAGLGLLSSSARRAQAFEFRGQLRAAGVRSAIALYDIRRFIY